MHQEAWESSGGSERQRFLPNGTACWRIRGYEEGWELPAPLKGGMTRMTLTYPDH